MPAQDMSSKLGKSSSPSVNRSAQANVNQQQVVGPATDAKALLAKAHNKQVLDIKPTQQVSMVPKTQNPKMPGPPAK